MKDKVQKIREEVERLRNLHQMKYQQLDTNDNMCLVECGKRNLCDELLSFIDSLEEYPVSGLDNGDMSIERWKQAVAAASNQKNYRSSKGLTETIDDYFVDGVQWADEHPKEEPVSEYLEEASKEWLRPQLDKSYADYGEVKMMELTHFDGYAMLDAIEFGAKWQKKQDQSTIELAEDHAMLAGMEKMKEQMMAKAIEAVVSQVPCSNEIILYNPSSVDKYYLPQEMNKLGLNKGDKIKLVIIKED